MSRFVEVAAEPVVQPRERLLSIIIAATVFNLALAALVRLVQAPIYLDAIGTIVVTVLIGVLPGAVVGVSSFALATLFVSPVYIWFSGTQVAIALFVGFLARRNMLQTVPRTVISGIALGVVAGVVSAPVIAFLFGGITGSGASLIAAYLLASGQNVLKAVALSGIAAEPVDKTLQLLIAVWVIRGLPRRVTSLFPRASYVRVKRGS